MSPEQVFFAFLCCWVYRCELSKHKSFGFKRQLIMDYLNINFLWQLQLIFSGDQEENNVLFFVVGIIVMGELSKNNLCVCKGQLMKIQGFTFSGDQ